jgi:hypothetical protein
MSWLELRIHQESPGKGLVYTNWGHSYIVACADWLEVHLREDPHIDIKFLFEAIWFHGKVRIKMSLLDKCRGWISSYATYYMQPHIAQTSSPSASLL